MEEVNSIAAEPEVPAVRVQDIEIVDAVIEWDWDSGDTRQWKMSVMPGNPVEGLVVRFLIESEYGVKNASVDAKETGAYFTAYYPSTSTYARTTFTAELELNGEIKRVPLKRVSNVVDNGYSFEELWNN